MPAAPIYSKYVGNGGGAGTVTSVGLALPSSILSVSGSPVTSAGTLTGSLVTQLANTVWAGPTTGAAANPTFRALVAADLPLTFGNLTDAGTDGIVVTGGTGAVIGSGTSIAQHVADSTHNGYLSSTDWVTFNGKQAAGNYITALTGDATATGPGSVALTLATVNGNVGSFGSSTAIPSFTVNAKGLITAASTNVVIAPAGTLTGTTLAANVVTSSLTSVGTIGTGVWQGTAVATGFGGTGLTTYTTGDLIYSSASNVLSKLAIGSTNQGLVVVGGVPTWQSIRSAIRSVSTAGQSIANAATPIIDFATADYATGTGTVTTGASWHFTVATPGVYQVTSFVMYASATFTAGNLVQLFVYLNGSLKATIGVYNVSATQSQLPAVNGSVGINCAAADTLDIRTSHGEGSARTLRTNSNEVWVSIALVTPT